nr:hypothetical protein B0A51_00720 [Rachicladosporium sp. CCFEE 5018]
MESESPSRLHSCAVCGKDASSRCAGCVDGVDVYENINITWYCSKTCQNTHWFTHKTDCKNSSHRKHLFRAGDALQQCFYLFAHKYWSRQNFSFTRDDADKLHVRVEEDTMAPDLKLYTFPGDDLPEPERQALLAHHMGPVAAVAFHVLTKHLLKGCCTDVSEVMIDAKPIQIISWIDCGEDRNNNEENIDSVPKITLKDGNTYALKLTSAQYGLKCVTPWDEFASQLIRNVKSVDKLSAAFRRVHASMMQRAHHARLAGKEVLDEESMYDCRMAAYAYAVESTAMSGNAIGAADFALQEREFLPAKAAFLVRFAAATDSTVAELRAGGGFAGVAVHLAALMMARPT